MYYRNFIFFFILTAFTNVFSANGVYGRRKRAGNGKNKNYDLCSRVFDVSNSTIIKTSDSLKNGARYLAAVQANTRDACERSCCSTDSCNVAVLEEKSKTSTDGDCFLFDCGSLDDFKCIFAVHGSYVSLGMMVNRVDLEKTRIHEQAKHEMDLKILKTPPVAQQPDAVPIAATTVAVMRGFDKQQQPPPGQQWPDDPDAQGPSGPQQQPNPKMAQQDGGSNIQQMDNGGFPMYDYSQQQQPPQQQQSPQQPQQYQQRPQISDGQMKQQPNQQVQQFQQAPDRPPIDPSRSFPSNPDQNPEPELQRKRPPVGQNPALQAQKISKPKALMDSRIDQPQRPPIYSEQMPRQNPQRQSCNRYQWPCASGDQCVAIYDRCSGISQCADGSDEQNCDQAPPSNNDASSYDDSRKQNAAQNPVQQPVQQSLPKQNVQQPNPASWNNYYKPDNGYQNAGQPKANQQQNSYPVQQNGNAYGDRQPGPQRQQNGYAAQPPRPINGNQRPEFNGIAQGGKQQQPSADSYAPSDLSTKKGSRVEFISIQKLDSSAGANGGETASLAVVMLGLGMAILALCLLYLSCRLRKVRRRLRRGKVLDTEEGEFLVNGMYL